MSPSLLWPIAIISILAHADADTAEPRVASKKVPEVDKTIQLLAVTTECREALQSSKQLQETKGGLPTKVEWSTYPAAVYDNFLRASLPPVRAAATRRVLDIGSGYALYNILASRHYKHNVEITLFDDTSPSLSNQAEAALYWHPNATHMPFSSNNLACSKAIMVANGVPAENVHTVRASAAALKSLHDGRFDLAFSHLSWGYHYPMDEYISAVYQAIKPGGRMVVTLRAGKVRSVTAAGSVTKARRLVRPETQMRLAESAGFRCHFDTKLTIGAHDKEYNCGLTCMVMTCRKPLDAAAEEKRRTEKGGGAD